MKKNELMDHIDSLIDKTADRNKNIDVFKRTIQGDKYEDGVFADQMFDYMVLLFDEIKIIREHLIDLDHGE